ncbi:MAG: PAS domain S-box protein [Oscillatoriales cyanobacterium]|nr:MAG: PAS domain S-box protein [Oscillatoriales cyanobacterium]
MSQSQPSQPSNDRQQRSPQGAAPTPTVSPHDRTFAAAAVQAMPLPVALIAADGCYIAASDRWREVLHLADHHNLVDTPLAQGLAAAAEAWQGSLDRARQGEPARSDRPQSLPLADGQSAWLDWEAQPWTASAIDGVLLSVRIAQSPLASDVAWQELFRQAGNYLCLIDQQGQLHLENDAWDAILGPGATNQQQPALHYLHPDDHEVTSAEFAALTNGASRSFENRFRRYDGHYRWLRWHAIWEPSQSIIYAIAQDVTERRALRLAQDQADRALRDNNERFRTMVANVPGVIYRCLGDEDRSILFASEAIETLTGYSTAQFIQHRNRTLRELTHPDDREGVWQSIQRAIAHQTPYNIEYRLTRANSELRWVSEQGQAAFSPEGKLLWLDGAIFDITDRKATEQALQDSRSRWSLLVQRMPCAILEWIPDGRIITWNGAASDLFGYSAAEMLNQPFDRIVPPEEVTKVYRVVAELLSGRGGQYCYNYNLTRDGRTILCEWYNSTLRDAHGQVTSCISIAFDITLRHQAESQLRQSEERYRCLVKALAQTTWNTSADGAVTEPMPDWAAFTGQSFEEYRNWGWIEAIHPDDRSYTAAAWQRAIERKSIYEVEHRLRRYDGEYRYVTVRAVPVLEANGQIREWVGVDTDITDRKQNELGLIDQERLLRTIIDTTPLAIWLMDAGGRIRLANATLCEMFGPTETALQSANHYSDLFGIEVCRQCVESDQQCLGEQRVVRTEEQFPCVDGCYHTFDVIKTPLFDRDGQVAGLLLVALDISDRKQIEAEQQVLMTRLHQQVDRERLINTLSAEIRKRLRGSQQSVIQFALAEIRTALGIDRVTFAFYDEPASVHSAPLTADQLAESGPDPTVSLAPVDGGVWTIAIESKADALPSILGTYQEATFQAALAGLARRELVQIDDVRQLSNRLERATFQKMHVRSLLVIPMRVHGSRVAAISCVQTRQAHIWQLEEIDLVRAVVNQVAIAQNQAYLFEQTETAANEARAKAAALEQALQELRQTQAQLVQQEKMSSLGQLVAGVAHEINNPVNFIYGNLSHTDDYTKDLLRLVQLYRHTYPMGTDPINALIEDIDLDFLVLDLPKMLQSMHIGAERIKEIVQSLRTFSRMDEAEMKAVNLHEGLDSTLTILNGRMKARNNRPAIEVVRYYGSLPLVECYPGQLNQVFMNLIANGIDALEERDRQRSMEQMVARPSQITITTEQLGDWAIVRITDNGPGIPLEVQQRLFDPFYTTKPVGKGTGLGLSISYQIVAEKHGGALTCTSSPGHGSTFVVSVPLQQLDAPS